MEPIAASSFGGPEHAPAPRSRETEPFEPASTHAEITAALVGLATALDQAPADEAEALATALGSGSAADIVAALAHDLGPDHADMLVFWLSEPDQPERRAILDSLFLGTGTASIRARITALNRKILVRNLFADARVVSLVRACHPMLESLS
jgi:hypothetical protein